MYKTTDRFYGGFYMNTSAVKDVSFDEDSIKVFLMDGRAISVPLVWYPKLYHATPEQRDAWEICGGGYGLHWEEIDEDLSTEGMLRGAPAPRVRKSTKVSASKFG